MIVITAVNITGKKYVPYISKDIHPMHFIDTAKADVIKTKMQISSLSGVFLLNMVLKALYRKIIEIKYPKELNNVGKCGYKIDKRAFFSEPDEGINPE